MSRVVKAKLPAEVRDMLAVVRGGVAAIDGVMNGPSTFERGQKVARAVNAICLACDSLERFGIKGWPPHRPRKAKVAGPPGGEERQR